jgi:hypothetical protein
MKHLKFVPLLAGSAVLIGGIVLQSETLGTLGFAVVTLSLLGFAGAAAWRAKVAEAKMVVAVDEALNGEETTDPNDRTRSQNDSCSTSGMM